MYVFFFSVPGLPFLAFLGGFPCFFFPCGSFSLLLFRFSLLFQGSECTKIARFSAVAAAIFTAPPQNRAIFKAPRCAISSGKKIASERRCSLRLKGTNLIPIAEFPAIPESAEKIASERRCAIFVHSAKDCRSVYEQRRVDLATFRAVRTGTWGHCPQVLVFTTVWDTPGKEKVAKWSSAPASILEGFNEIFVVHGPKKPYKTREKRQSCQVDPCLTPYIAGVRSE